MSNRTSLQVDVVVIGAGIAGASVACELAQRCRVLVLERENQPGYHSTGRSAALFTETYGNAVMRALTRASKAFLQHPPYGFADGSLMSARGTLLVATAADLEQLREVEAECRALVDDLVSLDGAGVRERVPCFAPEQVAAGLLEPGAMDIEVHALHQGFLRLLRAHGGTLLTGAEVLALERDRGRWRIETGQGPFQADCIVNAAGAWADRVGALAQAAPIGLVPKRRTAITFDPPPGIDTQHWPAVIDVKETWYFKPDAGRLLASPADETPSPPCDAQPEEYDVAVLVDRLTRATTLLVPRIRSRWAGLRSFVADKTIVAGFDTQAPDFFWLAGQGGYGIQTSAAVARAAAALLLRQTLPADIEDLGITPEVPAPGRASLQLQH